MSSFKSSPIQLFQPEWEGSRCERLSLFQPWAAWGARPWAGPTGPLNHARSRVAAGSPVRLLVSCCRWPSFCPASKSMVAPPWAHQPPGGPPLWPGMCRFPPIHVRKNDAAVPPPGSTCRRNPSMTAVTAAPHLFNGQGLSARATCRPMGEFPQDESWRHM